MRKWVIAAVLGLTALGAMQGRAEVVSGSAPSSWASSSSIAAEATGPRTATALMMNARGEQIGIATLTQLAKGVLINLNMRRLPPGELAFHVHEKGVCDAKNGFAGAGGHFNPAGKEHGHGSTDGAHAGDMPNQMVGQDGLLRSQVLNSAITLWPGTYSVLDADGAALVIHAGADDYKSQPAGDAGGRYACGVIKAER